MAGFQKFSETLIERFLSKKAYEITTKVCKDNFDQVFSEASKIDDPNDTTLGITFRKLEEIAQGEIADWVKIQQDEINIFGLCSRENPFLGIVDALLSEFEYYLDYAWMVDEVIGDEWHEKQEELEKAGIVDKHGDIIRK